MEGIQAGAFNIKSGGTYSYQIHLKENERTGTGDDEEEKEVEEEDGIHNTNFDMVK